jgi:mono/diheme cytochrome c family protein
MWHGGLGDDVLRYRSLVAFLWLAALSAVPAAHAASPEDAGASLFARKCAICHGPGGTGTLMLGLRLGKEHALLAERTDLTPALVRAIVRSGQRSMPPFTRVELPDGELTLIAAWLSRSASQGNGPAR